MTQAVVISPAPTLSKRIFAIDLRSLAFFRILLASCLAIDFLSALRDFSALYSDAGVLPRNAAIEFWSSSVTSSLYLMTGQPLLVDLLLVVHGAAILALLIGYRSRLAAALCFIFTASLQNRNFLVLQSSDDLMRLLVFWAMFAPIGGKWAVDAALNELRPPPLILSIGAIALQCQALFVYLFGALIKTQSAVWASGAAVGMAVADSTYGTELGRLFLGYPEMLRGLTIGVLALELVAPFLIWFPLRNTEIRLVTLVLVAMMHLGFVVFLHVGIFPLVSLTSLSLLLPGVVWDRLAARGAVQRAAATRIYYDDDCLFCFKTALLLREFCLPESVPVARATEHDEAKRLLDAHKSWVVYDDKGAPRLKWDAVAYVLRQSPVLWPLGRLFEIEALKPLGERLYRLIGDNRPILGRLTARLLPLHRDTGRPRLSAEFACLVLLAVVALYNVSTIPGYESAMPRWLADVVVDCKARAEMDDVRAGAAIAAELDRGARGDERRQGPRHLPRPAPALRDRAQGLAALSTAEMGQILREPGAEAVQPAAPLLRTLALPGGQ